MKRKRKHTKREAEPVFEKKKRERDGTAESSGEPHIPSPLHAAQIYAASISSGTSAAAPPSAPPSAAPGRHSVPSSKSTETGPEKSMKRKRKHTTREAAESEPIFEKKEKDEGAESFEEIASEERRKRSKKKRKKAKKENQEYEPVFEKNEREHLDEENRESVPVVDEKKKEIESEIKDESSKEESAKRRRKMKKKQREKRIRNAKSKKARKIYLENKIRDIVQVLASTGRYPKSWFFQSKPMLHDLVLTVYWGPAWMNPLLRWLLHGGWPKNSKAASGQAFRRPFDVRDFNPKLQADMRRYWPEPKKKFWANEWKHGRHSNMLPEEYFSTVMDIYMATVGKGINLQHGVAMPAKDAISSIEATLSKVQMSAFRLKDAVEDDTPLYIREVKILIDKDDYGIVSTSGKKRYLGQIKTDDELVVLATNPVMLQDDKKVDI